MAAVNKLEDDRRRRESVTSLYTLEEKAQIILASRACGVPPGILVRLAALEAVDRILAGKGAPV